MKKNALTGAIGILAMIFAGCKKEQAVTIETGTLLTYTNVAAAEFDRIDVLVDGKVAGKLTEPFTVKPLCGAANSASALNLVLTAGAHRVGAVQYKSGQRVGEWEDDEEIIVAGQCRPINWVE